MIENDYMEFQENLSKLFDGELDESQAQGILNEVANNSDLQALYNEQEILHSYLQNPYFAETEGLKEGILKKINLDNASIRRYKTRKYILRSVFVGLFLLALGGGYHWFGDHGISDKEMNKSNIAKISDSHITDNNIKYDNSTKRNIPIVSQTNLDKKFDHKSNESKQSYTAKSKFNSDSKKNYFTENTKETNIDSKISTDNTNTTFSNFTANGSAVMENEITQRNLLQNSNLFENSRVAFESNSSLPKYYLNPVYNYKTALILNRLNLQFNWYGLSKSNPAFKPVNSKTGILNDFSLFLMYKLTDKTSVGLSFGYDNFLMQYEGWEGNTKYRYKQEYSTPWIGCNINHRFEPILTFADYFEVSPFVQLNTAYANVGIYTQASAGLDLGISANTSLLVGFNSGWLLYKYENYEFTNKNGLSIGLKYGF